MGEYVVTVTDVGANRYEILSNGFFPGQANPIAQRTVKVLIEEERLFTQAMYGMGEIELGAFTYVDSYDSRLGAYGGANVSAEADLITTSISTVSPYAADLGASSVVNGDLTIGVGGDLLNAINLVAGSVITGSTGTLTRPRTPHSVPNVAGTLPNQGTLNVPAHSTVTISASAEYDAINIGNHATLIIDSDVSLYVDGAINFDAHSSMVIDSAATVSLVLNNTLTFGAHAQIINTSFDPKKFTIYCTDNVASFSLAPQGQFFGNVYMPNTDFTIAPFTDYYGSIVAKTISLGTHVNYHFDTSLIDDPSAPTFNQFVVVKWQGY
jgi:hypothetical protein